MNMLFYMIISTWKKVQKVTYHVGCCGTPVHVPEAVRPSKLKHQSLEQRKVYFRAEPGELVAHAHKNRTP